MEGILDYVWMAHELSHHKKEMNHSREFYKVLESVMPDYRWRQQWLKDNGMTCGREDSVLKEKDEM